MLQNSRPWYHYCSYIA